jgi:hypothetical protein
VGKRLLELLLMGVDKQIGDEIMIGKRIRHCAIPKSNTDQDQHVVDSPHRFVMGTQDNFLTFEVFEWLDFDQTQVVCTATDEEYARFITAALNTCKDFSPYLQIK